SCRSVRSPFEFWPWPLLTRPVCARTSWQRIGGESRPCARGEVLCAEPGRSHQRPDSCRAGSGGKSRTPSMYADEKSDEAVVLTKRPNKGRKLLAEVVEGRASPKGNSRQAAVVRTLSRVATSTRLAAVRRIARGLKPRVGRRSTKGGARCVS